MSQFQPNSPRYRIARLLGTHFWGLIDVLQILTFCASAYVLVKTAVAGVPQLDHELGPSGSLAAMIGVPVAGFTLLVAARGGAESAGGHRLVRGIGVLALLATLPLALSPHYGNRPPATAHFTPPHVQKTHPKKKPGHHHPRASSSKPLLLVAKGTGTPEHTSTAPADLTAKAAGCGCEKFTPDAYKTEGEKRETTEAPITEKPSHETAAAATTTTTNPTQTPPATPSAATTPATTPSSPASGSNIGTGDTGKNDSGNDDSGNNDSGSNDLGSNDAGNDDTGNNDVGNYDSGENDAGEHDSGNNDAGNNETGNNEV